jgi:hypothetical protein
MADCYGCPYRWHDEDCEYCGAKGDEIIDGKSYKKENCSYYKEYMAARGKPVTSSSSSSSSSYSSSSSEGCGKGCGIVVAIAVIIVAIAVGVVYIPQIFRPSEKAPASQQATAVVVGVNHALNMRDAASQDSKVITTIPKGETVTIIEMGTEYHLVQYGEHQGYCAAECLEIK